MPSIEKIILCQLNEQQYGIDVQEVRSIEKLQHITEIPNTPSFIKGIMDLRGEVIPIIDLKERLNLGFMQPSDDVRVLIAQIQDLQVGLIVDAATDVIDLDQEAIKPPPTMIQGIEQDFLHGVIQQEDRLFLLLNLEKVLKVEDLQVIKETVDLGGSNE